MTRRGARARVAATALALASSTLACVQTRRAAPPDASGDAPSSPPQRRHRAAVPPRGESPGLPASPAGLLADDAIRELQRQLQARGLLAAHREGELDAATSAAVRRFQQQEGLAATGAPDRETLRRLGVDPEEAYRGAGTGKP